MTDKECKDCGCTDIWDADCDECDGAGCDNCDETGSAEGLQECSRCGIISDAIDFDVALPD